MTEKEYLEFDFKAAAASDDAAMLMRRWIRKASDIEIEASKQLTGKAASLELSGVQTKSYESTISDVPNSSLTTQVRFGDNQLKSLWYASQEDLHQVVAEILQVSAEAEKPERPMTDLEMSLAQLFVNMTAESFGKAWPGRNEFGVRIDTISVNPKNQKFIRSSDLVSEISIQINLERGPVNLTWVSPRQQLAELGDQITDRRAPGAQVNIVEAVDGIPIEVVGLLGESRVSMRKLSQLKTGDLLVLNQRIDRPIAATINGKAFYDCWPGRVGLTQGLKIESCL